MRRIQAGNALSAFGLGFTVPYLYVYVAQVRDLGATRPAPSSRSSRWRHSSCSPSPGGSSTDAGPCPWWSEAPLSPPAVRRAWGCRAARRRRAVRRTARRRERRDAAGAGDDDRLVLHTSTRTRAFAMQFFLQNLGLGIGGLHRRAHRRREPARQLHPAVRDRGRDVPGAGGDRARAAAARRRASGRDAGGRRGQRQRRDARCSGTRPWCSCVCWALCCSSPATDSSSRVWPRTAPRPPGSRPRRWGRRWPPTPR